ncbi:EamA family transporter [Legionella hackeliae]|uniref:Cysteine and O-acetyl-L-serine efflux system n=1 Tax=Legionella hackeliae TaxID=449 RepID=A0A0A8UVI8_LEGHA|nr:EamA family transporter [Legionella hackeliae]KTD06663.1 integral membrane protein [Legionella hackeliae]CEK10784.1 cysteine and O-acetyl-L-serine efflux system [Legionella hackeliae]STX47522.1 integral membrane protein [Legionella hackeliae]
MPVSHILLALLVALVWGINFLFVKLSLEEISPLLLCTLRFTLASIPAIFFIKPPAVPFRLVMSYGLVMFALQFTLLFLGMHAGMTPGMASLLIQVQVFFSMLFATVFLKETPNPLQILGALVSFAGIGLVALHFDSNISVLGFILILGSAATWGFGNLITKKAPKINMISLVVWGSFVAIIPMFLITLTFEGATSIINTYNNITWRGASSLAYIVYISTWVGYGVWNWLLSRYPVGMIVPFTLLVPLVGILSSVIVLGEPFQPWKLAAGLLVISGLCINILSTRLFNIKLRREAGDNAA